MKKNILVRINISISIGLILLLLFVVVILLMYCIKKVWLKRSHTFKDYCNVCNYMPIKLSISSNSGPMFKL